MKCDYGCGREATTKFKNGKFCCSSHYLSCPSSSERQGMVTIAEKIITSEKCSYGCKRPAKYFFSSSKKYCCSKYLQSCPSIRKKNSKTNKVKQAGENNAMFGRKHSTKSIEKNRRSNIKLWQDPNSFFNSTEWRKRLSEAVSIRPNKPEKIIYKIVNKLFPDQFKYSGDFSFWVGRKNPDFIDQKNKLIIEHFGTYYHKPEDEQPRIDYFRKFGYKTLIIWETEIYDSIDKTTRKIKSFIERNN